MVRFMTLSWKVGRVAGIDIYLHPTLLLMVFLLGTTGPGMLVVAAAFGCILLHELGHALTARWFGIQTADITLYPIGGVARLLRLPRKPGPELLITLAGPAVNVAIALVLGVLLVLGGFFSAPYATYDPLADFVFKLMAINVGLAVFNLVPAFPMDGGRILRALLSGWLGRYRATQVAATVGQVLAVAFGVYSVVYGPWMNALLAMFVYFAAGQELASVQAEEYDGRANTRGAWPPAPAGYVWVPQKDGRLRLAPIILTVAERAPSHYRT
jgi:Zn-dependent protease